MDKLTIELPKSVTEELDLRHISARQVRAFVVEAIEAWLRIQNETSPQTANAKPSRFADNAAPFAEQLVRANRELFEQLAKL